MKKSKNFLSFLGIQARAILSILRQTVKLIFVPNLAVAIGFVLIECVDKDTKATIIIIGSGVIAIVGFILSKI